MREEGFDLLTYSSGGKKRLISPSTRPHTHAAYDVGIPIYINHFYFATQRNRREGTGEEDSMWARAIQGLSLLLLMTVVHCAVVPAVPTGGEPFGLRHGRYLAYKQIHVYVRTCSVQ